MMVAGQCLAPPPSPFFKKSEPRKGRDPTEAMMGSMAL